MVQRKGINISLTNRQWQTVIDSLRFKQEQGHLVERPYYDEIIKYLEKRIRRRIVQEKFDQFLSKIKNPERK